MWKKGEKLQVIVTGDQVSKLVTMPTLIEVMRSGEASGGGAMAQAALVLSSMTAAQVLLQWQNSPRSG